jgi:hypothetical protein
MALPLSAPAATAAMPSTSNASALISSEIIARSDLKTVSSCRRWHDREYYREHRVRRHHVRYRRERLHRRRHHIF